MVKKISKHTFKFGLVLVFFIVLVSPSYAFTAGFIGEAKDFYKKSDYQQAKIVLLKGMEKKKTAESLYWLGMVNQKIGRAGDALENFRIAIATDAIDNAKLNQSVLYVSLRELKEIENVLTETSRSNADFKQSLVGALKNKARNAIYKNKAEEAIDYYKFAFKFDPSVNEDAYTIFLQMAEKSSSASKKVDFYKNAIQFDSKEKKEIAILVANLAVEEWPSGEAKIYKNFASSILDNNVMDEIFPGERTKTMVLGHFTKADTNKEGYVTVYSDGKGKVEIGDKIEVFASMKDGTPYLGDKVKVATGNKWIPLKNGYDHSWINNVDGAFYVLMRDVDDVEFIVKVTRKYTPHPQKYNLALL